MEDYRSKRAGLFFGIVAISFAVMVFDISLANYKSLAIKKEFL